MRLTDAIAELERNPTAKIEVELSGGAVRLSPIAEQVNDAWRAYEAEREQRRARRRAFWWAMFTPLVLTALLGLSALAYYGAYRGLMAFARALGWAS